MPSPCILVCTLDAHTGICLGCGRTPAEIGEWPEASAARQRAIAADAARRLSTSHPSPSLRGA